MKAKTIPKNNVSKKENKIQHLQKKKTPKYCRASAVWAQTPFPDIWKVFWERKICEFAVCTCDQPWWSRPPPSAPRWGSEDLTHQDVGGLALPRIHEPINRLEQSLISAQNLNILLEM